MGFFHIILNLKISQTQMSRKGSETLSRMANSLQREMRIYDENSNVFTDKTEKILTLKGGVNKKSISKECGQV